MVIKLRSYWGTVCQSRLYKCLTLNRMSSLNLRMTWVYPISSVSLTMRFSKNFRRHLRRGWRDKGSLMSSERSLLLCNLRSSKRKEKKKRFQRRKLVYRKVKAKRMTLSWLKILWIQVFLLTNLRSLGIQTKRMLSLSMTCMDRWSSRVIPSSLSR